MHNPYLITEPRSISFSGGRTSAYMLYHVLQAHGGKLPDEAIVVFANTGKEDEATLKFVKDCEDNWNVKIHWVEYRPDGVGFAEVDYETASRNGEPFEMVIKKYLKLPNPAQRWCTGKLKIQTMAKFLRHKGFEGSLQHLENISFVGIRYDERRRAVKFDRDRLPLVNAKVTKEMVGEFWRNHAFDLQLPNLNGVTMHGNCDLCYLKPLSQIQALIREKPERSIWWAKMEQFVTENGKLDYGTGNNFSKNRPTYTEMARFNIDQFSLFEIDEEAIPCFCGD